MSNNSLKKTVEIINNNTELCCLFKFNLFSHDIEYRSIPCWDKNIKCGDRIGNNDLTNIKYYISSINNVEPSKQVLGEALFIVANHFQYHPVKEFIEKEKWDGIKRLDDWLINTTGCDDNEYTREAGKKVIVAAVNRVYNPGCKFDHMMILEGDQGIGKSTMLEELAGSWYLDTSFENKDKDLIDAMRSAMIIEVSELSGMNKKEMEWVKSFLVRKVDRVRLAYAERTDDFKRSCIFIGTYNPSGSNMYFRDDTGNRRFWPIECKKINIKYLRSVRSQLWAEAFEAYKAKEDYYITNQKSLDILLNMHGDREIESPTYYKIKKWLDINMFKEVTMTEVIESALGINTDGKAPKDLLSISTTTGIILRKLGWMKGSNQNRHKYFAPGNTPSSEVDWNE